MPPEMRDVAIISQERTLVKRFFKKISERFEGAWRALDKTPRMTYNTFMNHNKIIAVVGTNASGKSALGAELAAAFNGEIISADSRQVYRGFDLCCGKITAAETRGIPHHLLNIREVGDAFTVFDFQKAAYTLIPQIIERGKLPFIVGGTGLYVSSVADGYVLSGAARDSAARSDLENLSVSELKSLIPDIDFLGNNPSDAANKRRLIRIVENGGKPLSREARPRYDVLRLGLTWQKERLHAKIDERLAARIREGMIGEVKSYLDNGGGAEHLNSFGLEYRAILQYLNGEFASLGEFERELSRRIKKFAKRQMTWFKRDKNIHWLNTEADYTGEAKSLITEFITR